MMLFVTVLVCYLPQITFHASHVARSSSKVLIDESNTRFPLRWNRNQVRLRIRKANSPTLIPTLIRCQQAATPLLAKLQHVDFTSPNPTRLINLIRRLYHLLRGITFLRFHPLPPPFPRFYRLLAPSREQWRCVLQVSAC